jgi:hypothetical protein
MAQWSRPYSKTMIEDGYEVTTTYIDKLESEPFHPAQPDANVLETVIIGQVRRNMKTGHQAMGRHSHT